jgi:hypothetical protein
MSQVPRTLLRSLSRYQVRLLKRRGATVDESTVTATDTVLKRTIQSYKKRLLYLREQRA